MITWCIQFCVKPPGSQKRIVDYRHVDFESIRKEMGMVCWDALLAENADSSSSIFKDVLLSPADKFLPKKTVANSVRRQKPVWMTHSVEVSEQKKAYL